MRVLVVQSAGFCWGVAEAIDKALDIAKRNEGPVYTYGPLVHNKQVMSELDAQHIHGIDASPEGIAGAASGTIVVRAHGVRPEVLESLQSRAKDTGGKFYDLTCPLVTMVHNVIRGSSKRGYDTVIVGDADHAEVIGLVGYGIPGRTHVVANPAEAAKLPEFDKVCVVSQTTQDMANFRETADIVSRKAKVVREINTICRPTRERQEETEALARRVTTMVVVGGRHSANTVRLVEMLKGWGCRPIHVETETELRKEDFDGLAEVGVTAGASTPSWMIDRVVETLGSFGERHRTTALDVLGGIGSLFVHTNLYVAAGAAGLSLAACALQGIPVNPLFLIIPALFVLSMHTLNRYVDRTRLDFADPVATFIYKKRPLPFLVGGALAGVASVVLAAFLGWMPFALALLGVGSGCLYGMRLIPEALTQGVGLGFRRLKDIPASRDLSTAIGWTMMTAVLPFLSLARLPGPENLLSFLAIFLMVFLRTTVLGVRDVAGDKIVGQETVFKALGRSKTRTLEVLMLFGIAACLAGIAFGFHVKPALWVAGVVPYTAIYTLAFFKWGPPKGIGCELTADGQNLIAGALVLIALLA